MRNTSGRAWHRFLGCALWCLWVWVAQLAPAYAQPSAEQPSPAQASFGQSSSAQPASCIDEAIRDELNARRRYRGVQKRSFQKAGRHELSVLGGVYAADLLSSSYLVSGAYTFHFTEDLGLEASFGYTKADSALVRIVQADTSFTALRLHSDVYIYEGHLLWSIAYGKLRWFSGTVSRFDLFLAFGGGVTDNQSAQGLTGSFGLGMKYFFGDWFAVRLDLRDQLLQQELIGHSQIVNNLAATLGLSVFLPFES
ncbi:MAG TPA: outer membrane beta-barrel domain-containing protein [Polyangiales bacterium]